MVKKSKMLPASLPAAGNEQHGTPNGTRESSTAEATEAPAQRPVASPRWYVRLGLIALVIVFSGAAAGLVGGYIMPDTHAARAEIMYPITEEQPTGFLREDRNLTTQLVLLESRAVLGPAAAAEGEDLADLEQNVEVSPLDSSEIIRIEVHDNSPERALSLVESIVAIYLDRTQDNPESNALEFLQSELADVQTRISDTEEEVADLRAQQEQSGVADPQLDNLSDELSSLVAREQDLQSQVDEIQTIELSGPLPEPTTQPYVLPSPVSPGADLLAAAGALTGVVIAAGVVALAIRRQSRG